MAADSVGQIGLDLVINKNGFDKQLIGIQSLAKKTGKILAAAFTVKKLADFGKECIELGSDLAEVQNVVDVVFPHMNKQIDGFAKNAAAQFGLSETMTKKFTGTFGAMSKAFGFGEKQAYDMSTTLTGLAGDVASFYNISQDEAYTKLKSVFTGETESLKDLGVVMTQTALDSYAMVNGFGKTTAKMSEMEKVALRYQFVQDQLTSAVGDFSRTSDGWANQVRILKLQFDSLKAPIGQGLINVLSPVIKVINMIIGKLMTLANAFKSFTELLSGKKGSGGAASGMADVAVAAGKAENATSGVGDAAKKTAKELKGITTGIDELNIIDQPTDSSSGSGSGGGYSSDTFDMGTLADTSALDETENKMQALINRMKELAGLARKGFWDGFGDTSVFQSIRSELDGIKKSLKNIFLAPEVQKAAGKFADSVAYNLGKIAGSGASIGATVADNILGGIELYLNQNSDRIKKHLISMFDIRSDIAEISGNFAEAIAEIFSAFRSDSAKQITADLIAIFVNPIMTISEILLKFGQDIFNLITQPIVDNKETIKQVLQELLNFFQPSIEVVKDLIVNFVDSLGVMYNSVISPLIQVLTDVISVFVLVVMNWILLLLDTIEKLRDGWAQLEEAGAKIWNSIKTTITTTIRTIQTGISSALTKIQTNWKNIWTSVKITTAQIFTDMWTTIKSTINAILAGVESMANGVVRAINKMVDALNNLSFDIPDWVPGLGGKSFHLNIPKISEVSIPRLAQGGFVRANTPQLAMIGDNRHQGEIVAPEDKMQAMVDRAVAMVSNQNMSEQYLLVMIDLLKRIIEVIQALDLTVNIDIRDIKTKLKELENRSGYQLRMT